ncbi:phage baseplate assembly protein V [Pseudomonas sp. B392_1p]|uniref:phage baseplate assembly protein V n=1 Tax=Pseudomonas sp. B392_1p TaxID=3457507 RepID=UPI003FD13C5B
MSFALAEHDRMIANLAIECFVVAVDTTATPPVCRVSDGEWTSAWVRWHAVAAGSARHWRAPSIGEQGVLFSPSGDPASGTFVPGLYGEAGEAPDDRDHVEAWHFPDGGKLLYDWTAKRYSISLPTGTVEIAVGGTVAEVTDSKVTVTAGAIGLVGPTTIDGPLTVNGPATLAETLAVAGSAALNGGAALSGDSTVTGKLNVSGDILGGGRIIDTLGNTPNHKH